MAEGVDYSAARPGGAALAAAGKTFVVRYLAPNGEIRGNKGLTNAEIADLRAHGIAIVVVYESYAARAGEGRAAGEADAPTAQGLLDQLDLDHRLPIYFAVDYDAVPAAVTPYFEGVRSVLGYDRTGVYGSYRVVNALRDAGLARWLWQTYAWSGGLTSDGIHLKQYLNDQNVNGSVDLDRSYQDNFGQFGVAPPATIQSGDDEVALIRAVQLVSKDNTFVLSHGRLTHLKDAPGSAAVRKVAGTEFVDVTNEELVRDMKGFGLAPGIPDWDPKNIETALPKNGQTLTIAIVDGKAVPVRY
jgi:hypothetical protein